MGWRQDDMAGLTDGSRDHCDGLVRGQIAGSQGNGAVPFGAGVAVARANTRPLRGVVMVTVTTWPAASPPKVTFTVTALCAAVILSIPLPGLTVWVTLMAGLLTGVVAKAATAYAPASSAAPRSRKVAAWAG